MEFINKGSRENWLSIRKKYIGSSDIASLFDASPFKSKFALWHEKAGNYVEDLSDKRMDAGSFLEAGIAEWFAYENGLEIEKAMTMAVDDVNKLAASPDYFINLETGKRRILEVKNVDYAQFKEKWQHGAPLNYQLQVILQMMLYGCEMGDIVACISGNQLYHYEVPYNEKVGALMVAKAREFWQSIKEGREPSISSHNDYDVVKALSKGGAKHIDLRGDNHVYFQAKRLQKVSKVRLKLKKQEEVLKAELLHKLHGYETGSCEGLFLSRTVKKGNAGTVITEKMIGEVVNKRAESVGIKFNFKEEN